MTEIVMSLEEYLTKRTKGRKNLTALTKLEAQIIGLPYPLRRHWAKHHKNLILGPAQLAQLEEALSVHRESKKERKTAKTKERYIKALQYGWEPPVPQIQAPEPSGPKVYRVPKHTFVERKKRPPPAEYEKYAAGKKFFSSSLAFVATDEFLESFEWRRVRMLAIKKYGAKCMCCGVTPAEGAVMNVDHIKPRKKFPELALNMDNLQILCHDCNHGKGNWDMTDWRK